MITERQYIKDNLWEFFDELLKANGIDDVPLIWSNENEPRPESPFLMLEFRSTVSLGMPDYSRVSIQNGKESQRITQNIRRNMTMHGFGERSIDVLETIKSQLNINEWADKLRIRNLVIPQTMETLENSRSSDTAAESGASFDFYLTYIRVVETNPGYIEDVGIESSFE